MLPTYPAILRDGRIEWDQEVPINLVPGDAVHVPITLLEPVVEPVVQQPSTSRGECMAAALERLAALPTSNLPVNPLAWERETREDRARAVSPDIK
jgi:hypothetical protein